MLCLNLGGSFALLGLLIQDYVGETVERTSLFKTVTMKLLTLKPITVNTALASLPGCYATSVPSIIAGQWLVRRSVYRKKDLNFLVRLAPIIVESASETLATNRIRRVYGSYYSCSLLPCSFQSVLLVEGRYTYA